MKLDDDTWCEIVREALSRGIKIVYGSSPNIHYTTAEESNGRLIIHNASQELRRKIDRINNDIK